MTADNSDLDPQMQTRFAQVRARIEAAARNAGRDAASITLIGASKTRTVGELTSALSLGLTDFGENYLDEALPKIQGLAAAHPTAGATWHFIGRVQSNKTRSIAHHFDWVHTVSRDKIARRLSEQRDRESPLNVLIQVNVDADPDKAGVTPDGAQALAELVHSLPRLRARGLMTILARDSDPVASYQSVAQLAADIRTQLSATAARDFDALSMGMSGDLEAAIAAGATQVRVGTDLFGPRDTRDTKGVAER